MKYILSSLIYFSFLSSDQIRIREIVIKDPSYLRERKRERRERGEREEGWEKRKKSLDSIDTIAAHPHTKGTRYVRERDARRMLYVVLHTARAACLDHRQPERSRPPPETFFSSSYYLPSSSFSLFPSSSRPASLYCPLVAYAPTIILLLSRSLSLALPFPLRLPPLAFRFSPSREEFSPLLLVEAAFPRAPLLRVLLPVTLLPPLS